jgi:hypothetical protein
MSDHYVCKGCGADPRYGEKCTCDEKPLFVPLRAEHYDAFLDGSKREEYRLYGKGWNERVCRPGRAVVLSRGYGKQNRIRGRIRDFSAISFYDLTPKWRKAVRACYGQKLGRGIGRATIARIGIVDLPRMISFQIEFTI